MAEQITAFGHKNIRGTHKTTFEFTKDRDITPRGDCIIAVASDKGSADLSTRFKKQARNPGAKITVTIAADGVTEIIKGRGHPNLTFTHPTDIVARTSEYICSRTLMIKADKSSKQLNKKLIEKMKNPDQKIEIQIKTDQ
ncbi:MAG TPA: DUF371 domain-containing protein [Euryarchaeota archaeon]|nr:hypothetical protein BMS3Abin16_01490 [archaeon BMS3Abin16]HDH28100.1 DUF371 domain-containing protein [Euryarchaeota archaeon]